MQCMNILQFVSEVLPDVSPYLGSAKLHLCLGSFAVGKPDLDKDLAQTLSWNSTLLNVSSLR